MANRKTTLNLPTGLVRQAKVYAAQHDTTIDSLSRELLEEKLSRESRARVAVDRLLDIADRGPHFTLDPGSIPRDERHERR